VKSTTSLRLAPVAARVRRAASWLLLALAFVWHTHGDAQTAPQPVSERSVKAAFLYKFASYVQWPNSESAGDSPIVIGVLGGGDFARELAEITMGRSVSNRPIRIRRLDRDESADGLDILFIGDELRADLPRVLEATREQPILTVTESAGAIADGSIINFTVDAERVRFEVSLYAAELRRLRLNARLLAVAQAVYREPE
jgi:hypothetical protein